MMTILYTPSFCHMNTQLITIVATAADIDYVATASMVQNELRSLAVYIAS